MILKIRILHHNQALRRMKIKLSRNRKTRLSKIEKQDFRESKNKTFDNIQNSDTQTEEEWIDRYTKTVDEIKKQIDYDYLIDYAERDIVDEVVNIMAEVMTVPRPKYKIEGDFVEYDAVLNNLKKITAEQLEVCLLAYSRQRQRIRNPKAYWISVLYNIPLTSNIVLQNMVNSDLYETGG